MTKPVHIIGAGVSGLAAAVALAKAGYTPFVYEAGPQAGGRCRTYYDKELGTRIDNGNHLLLSGNRNVMRYLATVGARGTLTGPSRPLFPFIDLADGERWLLRPSRGRLPLWLFDSRRRVPGTKARDYFEPLKLAFAKQHATVAQTLDPRSVLYRRLWDPLSVSALNTHSGEGSARLFWTIIRETLGTGGANCIPLVPKQGLSETLVDPAIAYVEGQGGRVELGKRVSRLMFDGGALRAFEAGGAVVAIGPDVPVVLAVTAPVAATLVPGLKPPTEHRSIVNLHYKIDVPKREPGFIGVVGGAAEWVFAKDGILSVTISAAERYVDQPAESVAALVWKDLQRIYSLQDPMPRWRMVKEKRATFAATPEQVKLRPHAKTRWQNLYLAGDWTETGLPGTIEGSVRSGHAAARLVQRRGSGKASA